MDITSMKPVSKRDGRPVEIAFWQPVESDGPCWACARCGDILRTGIREKFLDRLFFCLCGQLNEVA